jgi:hypothetical protein
MNEALNGVVVDARASNDGVDALIDKVIRAARGDIGAMVALVVVVVVANDTHPLPPAPPALEPPRLRLVRDDEPAPVAPPPGPLPHKCFDVTACDECHARVFGREWMLEVFGRATFPVGVRPKGWKPTPARTVRAKRTRKAA